MEKENKQNKNKKSNPIKLDDLIPRENVTGGRSKTVFGIIRDSKKKERRYL